MTTSSASEWWERQRLRYNLGLAAAGLLAFILYVRAISVRCSHDPDAEITLFTTGFQAVGYIIAMGLANICYQLGPVLERRVPPDRVGVYRRVAYSVGFSFSVGLPFLVPLFAGVGCRR